jgi:hypothetical protein
MKECESNEETQMATTVEITRTYYQSPLGLLRVGGTDTYISEILFVDRLDEEDYRGRDLGGPVTPVVIQCIEADPVFSGTAESL